MDTFLSMVGYCLKDNGEDYFEFVIHHNASFKDRNEGKLEYAKFEE